jgi:DNA (cytosine-5)-methyltransferase 1
MTATTRPQGTKTRPIAIDLFCGAGGMSLGMERAGFEIVFAVDYDGYHVATHERNFPYGKTKCGSVQDLTGEDVRREAGIRSDEDVALLFGGPPCQGFSAMGLRDAQDPRNTLIFHFARIVDELRPKAFVMENVTGLNMGSTRPVFEAFLDRVAKHYNVTTPVQVLTATDFGVPQARKRLFVLGIRSDVGVAAHYPGPQSEARVPTVWQAIGDLPRVEVLPDLFDADAAPYPRARPKNAYGSLARGTVALPHDYSHYRTWDSSRVSGCQRVKHTDSAIRLYDATAPGGIVPGHKLPRLHPDGICPTLRAGATSERGSHTAPRPVHPFAARVITAREAARLHGYPDWFSFYPAKMHAYRQIGNSVCPPVAHAVGLSIMQAIGVDPSLLPRRTVTLNDAFDLPVDRPTQHARIPVKIEYPKIVNYLWGRAYDAKRKRLRQATIAPEDIREAIAATNANLPRVRPERFLYEAGQQRAIRDILALPLSHGYSIAITDKETGAGIFQPADAAHSLGRQTAIVIRSKDLNRAASINSAVFDTQDLQGAFANLEASENIAALTGGKYVSIEFRKDLFGQPLDDPALASVVTSSGRRRTCVVIVSKSSSLPFDRLQDRLTELGVRYGIVVLLLTQAHFAVVLVNIAAQSLVEERRFLFAVSDKHVAACKE